MNKFGTSISYLLKLVRHIILRPFDQLISLLIVNFNGVALKKIKSYVIPKINISVTRIMQIDSNFDYINRNYINTIVRFNICSFSVSVNIELILGENRGLSSKIIVSKKNNEIGRNIVINDKYFLTLNSKKKLNRCDDIKDTITKPIKTGNNTFIGAYLKVLKRANIVNNSIFETNSIITKSLPDDEICAGNPFNFYKKII